MDPTNFIFFSSLAVLGYWIWGLGRRERRLPLGPPTKPIIGNILPPKAFLQLQFSAWAREYGAVYSLKVFNSTMIVISSASAVKEILDKCSVSTAGRPPSIMQLANDGRFMPMENADTDVWRHSRKAFQMFLTAEAVDSHLPTQQAESIQLLHDLLTTPQELYTHIMRTTVSLIASLVYGKRVRYFKNSEADMYFQGTRLVNELLDVTRFPPIEIMPWIKYIPRWLAPWTAHCDQMMLLRNTLYDSLLDECEEAIKMGNGAGCYIEKVLNRQAELGLSRKDISYLGATLMDGGAETTSSYLHGFMLALLSYPECQKRIQTEIDTVVGSKRMPNLADYEKLPYLQAFTNEVQRLRPLLPVAVPHMATIDITYKGSVIPKGSTLFMNTWGIMHDPDVFEAPETFRPERYLETEFGTKPGADTDFRNNLGFGAGRRICPGEKMGLRTVALNTMNLVWAFDFSPLKKTERFTLSVDQYMEPGIMLIPKPFVCDVKVRGERRAEMIRSSFSMYQ